MSRPKKDPLADDPLQDICPVCKSNRYLNPSLQFLINPECYHKMCSTCVDRIFTSGPASCPVPHCGKTLRKKGFHKAFFGDLSVERECDIRKRVGEAFNRRQDEFETLRDWNDYLEMVESTIFDLISGTNKERYAAEETLRAYRLSNEQEIEDNRLASLEARDYERTREIQEREASKQRRLAILREQEEEKMDVENEKLSVLERLANSNGNAAQIALSSQKAILKKSSARRHLSDSMSSLSLPSSLDAPSNLSIRGLKRKIKPEIEKAYDPFGGIDLRPTRYVLQESYENEWLDGSKRDQRHMAGGYSLHEYYARTMFEAFSGLGVFIEDKDKGDGGSAVVKSEMRVKMEMDVDDVF